MVDTAKIEMPKSCCKNCKHAHPEKDGNGKGITECRRFPPHPQMAMMPGKIAGSVNAQKHSFWPTVQPTQFCGEWALDLTKAQ